MKLLRNLLDKQKSLYEKGGKLEKLYPLYEAIDTFLFTPGQVTKTTSHVRDGLDLKRMMVTVVYALIPCILMACYNTGMQANLAYQQMGKIPTGCRADIMNFLGIAFQSTSVLSNFVFGLLYFLPVLIVTFTVGGLWEAIFSSVRKHEINEGFLVTGFLFPLTLPPTIPLWQVAVGITFGVVFAKEVFGGTGRNFLNPALTARAFLFFAYPAQISGDQVWVGADGFTGATELGRAAVHGLNGLSVTWQEAFFGLMPGSMGETSTLACLIGAAILICSKIGSWRIMLSMTTGTFLMVWLFNLIGSDTNPMFSLTPQWHFVLGGFAFGTIFMATDPVSASMTQTGQYIYGLLIGTMIALIRVINPAFPEGTMLAILFGNVFAPLIDFFIVKGSIKRRLIRHGQR